MSIFGGEVTCAPVAWKCSVSLRDAVSEGRNALSAHAAESATTKSVSNATAETPAGSARSPCIPLRGERADELQPDSHRPGGARVEGAVLRVHRQAEHRGARGELAAERDAAGGDGRADERIGEGEPSVVAAIHPEDESLPGGPAADAGE